MLKDTEWLTINKILLELYTVNDITHLAEKTMKVLRMLIPYTKGYFIMLDEKQDIRREDAYFVGMDKSESEEYIDDYYEQDYLKYLYEFSAGTCVYQDTSILDEDVRKNTPFYKRFLRPFDIPYGCGIMIIRNGQIIGIFNLFRSEALGDFSEKDIYILNVLKNHIENMIVNSMQLSRQQVAMENCLQQMKEKYGITDREKDILKLIGEGCSNSEICDKLVVSLSTVKKHVYNIYTKTGVKSRTQLLNLLYSQI